MEKRKKLKSQKNEATLDRGYRMLDLGLKQGRKEVIDKLIELLGLDERYELKT